VLNFVKQGGSFDNETKNSMERWDDKLNELSDTDWGWFPFLFLRPQKQSEMDIPFLIKLTLFFSPHGAIFFGLMFWVFYRFGVFPNSFLMPFFVLTFILYNIAFFLSYQWIVAPAWNRRARKLQAEQNNLD
jgi:hypothetical protein